MRITLGTEEFKGGPPIELLKNSKKKIAVFWVVAPCNLVEVYGRLRGFCCLHKQGDEWQEEAERTSETSVNFYQTARRNNSEDSDLHTRRRENLKSYVMKMFCCETTILRSRLF
jgi:hypothetical protein